MSSEETLQMPDASEGILFTLDHEGKTRSGVKLTTMRILLAENQPKVRFALRVLLETVRDFEIAGEIAEGAQLVNQTKVIKPDVVLLHWGLQDVPAAEVLSSLRQACPNLRIIALSARSEARDAALAAGADAFVSKMDPPDRLLAAIRECCS